MSRQIVFMIMIEFAAIIIIPMNTIVFPHMVIATPQKQMSINAPSPQNTNSSAPLSNIK